MHILPQVREVEKVVQRSMGEGLRSVKEGLMPKGAYARIEAFCPYYRWERKQDICCESPAGEEGRLHLTFREGESKSRWVRTYCVGGNDCPVARMLDEEAEKKDPD